MLTLPITKLKGVGPRTQELLAQLTVFTVQDLLFHLPLRYQDRTRIAPIGSLREGDQVFVEGQIESGHVGYGRRRHLLCRLSDRTGHIFLRFYHFNQSQQKPLTTPGTTLSCYGTVRRHYRGGLEMIHPEYRLMNDSDFTVVEDRLTPIYSTTKGLQQTTLRKLIQQALALLLQSNAIQELLPEELLKQFKLPPLIAALQYIHQPPKSANTDELQQGRHPAQQRLIVEELLTQQLGVRLFRAQVQRQKAWVVKPVAQSHVDFQQRLRSALPFQLTAAQVRVISEINSDLEKPHPMLRLVQGDVGSGKTVVAAIAIARTIECGYQAAVMVPTELLAEQHRASLQQWFQPLGINVGWLSGSVPPHVREETIRAIADGQYGVVVGTHALFQDDVKFCNLALVVIDEQHRFGVHQRLALKSKGVFDGNYPHQLIMTATPIPRTLAMTAYADLDISVIDELPPGRKPVTTILVTNERRDEVIERIKNNCEQGRQAYWVCTLIEDSLVLQCETATATYENLRKNLPNVRVGLIHGRLNKTERDNTMAAFKRGEIDLLVATTIIEVGVDVPNASLMVIENSERFGLSQIHQLRGRIGRGSHESHCVLLYQKPLSLLAKQRLSVLRETHDGFLIAQKDLELRGPGELLGVRQSGLLQWRVADWARDHYLLPRVQQAAALVVHKYPDIIDPLLQRWLKRHAEYAGV